MIKGSKMSVEAKTKISKSLIGNKRAVGYKFTDEQKKKVSEAGKGRPSWIKGKKWSEEVRKKLSKSRLGKKFTLEHRKNMSGNNHWNWKGGITSTNEMIRKSLEYKLWRQAVFERDKFTCIWCGRTGKGVKINADHIKPFALYPELRFAIDNGRTLCRECHLKTDTYAGKIIKYRNVG